MQYFRLALLLVLLSCNQTQKSTPEISKPEITQIVSSDNLEIAFDGCGEGEVSVVFIHGWCIDRSYWSHQLAALCDQYQVISLDLPGHGESGDQRQGWTVEKFGQDVSAAIQQLDLQQVILVGHSMGGDVMLEAGLLQKDRIIGIIGVDTFKDTGALPDSLQQMEIDNFMQYARSDFQGAVSVFAEQFLFSSQTDSLSRSRVLASLQQADTSMAVAALESLFDYAAKEIPQLQALDKKLYLINSDVTPTLQDYFKAAAVDYEVIDIVGTGHYPMIEKPAEFTNLLQQTVNRIVKESQI